MSDLNTRQQKLIRLLLSTSQTTAAELARRLGVSTKTIYSDIRVLKPILSARQVSIKVAPRKGIMVIGEDSAIQDIMTSFKRERDEVLNSDVSRERYILSRLLREREYISIEQLAETLYISRRVIERNLDNISRQLLGTGIELLRTPGRGIKIIGEESEKRKVLFRMLNQYWGNTWQTTSVNEEWLKDPAIVDNPNIDNDEIKKIVEIVRTFSGNLHLSLSDYAVQSLVIHLAIAVHRIEEGNALSGNDELIQNVGNERKAEAVQLAELVEQRLGVRLPDEEVAYIQIHLIAASADQVRLSEKDLDFPVSKRLKDLLRPFGYDKDLLMGLSIHMQTTVKRLKVNAGLSNPYTEEVKQSYPQAFDEALIIADDYEKQYDISMNDDEVAYVAFHVEAFLERRRTVHQKVKAVIVCSTGLGSAQLLAAKVRREFSEIVIKGIWSLHDFHQSNLAGIDIVISTINLPDTDIPSITVSPVMSLTDVQMIKSLVGRVQIRHSRKHAEFLDLVDSKLMWIDSSATSWKDVIRNLGSKLIQFGFAREGLVESALAREKLSFTSFDNYAIPHAQPTYVLEPAIAICTLQKPIDWGEHKVEVVFFLAMSKTMNQQQMDSIFDDLYDIVADTTLLKELTRKSTARDLISGLEGEIG